MKIGAIELKVQRNVQYTGRKAIPGRICFDDNDRMVVHVGYCPDCRCKVNISLQDAKNFTRLYGENSSKQTRLINKLRT